MDSGSWRPEAQPKEHGKRRRKTKRLRTQKKYGDSKRRGTPQLKYNSARNFQGDSSLHLMGIIRKGQ
jgi:hypothetical protein